MGLSAPGKYVYSMSLLDTLKSLLGLESSRQEPGRGGDVGVTVEREPGEDSTAPEPPTSPGDDEVTPDATTEHEVKGTDEADGAPDTDRATESTPDEAGTAPAGDDAAGAADEAGATPSADEADEPTSEIKGIGPSYADRLAEAGVESIGDLAAADPAELAEQTDLSEKRLGRWVERAQAR
jgi:predicted flap endonuclease-1-like 5' DNA nuclease